MSTRSRTFKIGAFLAIAFATMIGVLFFLGRTHSFFARKMEIIGFFANTAGLVIGSPVAVAGINVGTVDGIELSNDLDKKRVIVRLSIVKRYSRWIRQDSVAELASLGLLGDLIVNISIGSPGLPELGPNAIIQTRDSTSITDVVDIARTSLGQLASLTSTVGERLRTVFTDEFARDVGRTARSTADIAEAVERGPGLANALVFDHELRTATIELLRDARRTARRIDRSIAKIEDLLENGGEGGGLESLAELSAELRDIAKEVRDGDGPLHALIYADQGSNLVDNLTAASSTIKKLMDEIDHGDGTIGGLIKDPTVYRDLRRIVGNVRRNVILKSLVRLTIDRDHLERSDESVARARAEPGSGEPSRSP